MKLYPIILLLLVLLTLGCAHGSQPFSSPAPTSASIQPEQVAVTSDSEAGVAKSPGMPAEARSGNPDRMAGYEGSGPTGQEASPAPSGHQKPPVTPVTSATSTSDNTVDDVSNLDFVEEGGEGEKTPGIADPLEPFNRAMFQFNDKLYFWVLKPVAQGYKEVVPESARVSVSNFFSNLAFPVRFVNALLQADFSGASTEFGRFIVNTVWGIGGLMDPASSKDIQLSKQDHDFGETLGVYGLGQGFYINWPLLGPSSPRDTAGVVGDFFLHPLTYSPTSWETSSGVRGYDKVNTTSLSLGDYESLKEAAIDPYVAIRDAYVQYRLKKVNAAKEKAKPGSGKPDSVPESGKTAHKELQ